MEKLKSREYWRPRGEGGRRKLTRRTMKRHRMLLKAEGKFAERRESRWINGEGKGTDWTNRNGTSRIEEDI